MPGAQIAFNQAGNPIPFGTPGIARDDIWQSNPVACQSTLSGNVTYLWAFLDVPPGSGATFTGSTTATATFTPDLLGTYRIQLTTNGGGLGNVMILVVRVRKNSTGVLQHSGICLPAFGERVGEDNVLIPPVSGPQNARGYAPFFEELYAYMLTLGGSDIALQQNGTPLAGGPFGTLDFIGATLANLGGGVASVTVSSVPSYSLDCSAGGVVPYIGPTPVPPTVFLTGTPGSTFSVTWPAASFVVNIVNLTSQLGLTGGTGNPGTISVLPISGGSPAQAYSTNASGVILQPAGPTWGAGNPDVNLYNETYGTIPTLINIGGINDFAAGALQQVPIWGTYFRHLDAATWGVTPPGIGIGPAGGPGMTVWATNPQSTATLIDGWMVGEVGGLVRTVAPHVYFQNVPWNTQALIEGGAVFGDTLTGPFATGSCAFNLPLGVTTATVKCLARVVSTSGSTETPDDTYVMTSEMAWSNISGTVVVLTTTNGVSWEFVGPSTSATPVSLVDMDFSSTTNGTQGTVSYATGALDPSTIIDIQVHVMEAAAL